MTNCIECQIYYQISDNCKMFSERNFTFVEKILLDFNWILEFLDATFNSKV